MPIALLLAYSWTFVLHYIYLALPYRFDIRTLHRIHVFHNDIEASFEIIPVVIGIKRISLTAFNYLRKIQSYKYNYTLHPYKL